MSASTDDDDDELKISLDDIGEEGYVRFYLDDDGDVCIQDDDKDYFVALTADEWDAVVDFIERKQQEGKN